MKLIELIGVIIVVGTVIGFLVIEDGVNKARIDEVSSRYQNQVDSLFNRTTQLLLNFTNVTEQLNTTLSSKDTTIQSLNEQIITLNNQKTEIQTLYNNLLNNFNSTVNARIYDIIQQLDNVSQLLNETLSQILHNPTQAELETFLSNDQTDANSYNNTNYSSNYYVCTDFSRDLIFNASLQGWKSVPVLMDLQNESFTFWHSIVVFNTTDHGLVFVEPQTDAFFYNLTYNDIYIPYNSTVKHMVIVGVI